MCEHEITKGEGRTRISLKSLASYVKSKCYQRRPLCWVLTFQSPVRLCEVFCYRSLSNLYWQPGHSNYCVNGLSKTDTRTKITAWPLLEKRFMSAQFIPKLRDHFHYGWVVLIAIFFIGTVIWGLRLSFGVFFKPIQSEFDFTRTTTSAVFSLYMLLCCVVAILGG